MPRKTFVDGTDALASEVNTYLMDQVVQTYADATARNVALTSPTEGQVTYLADINQLQATHGSNVWYPVAGQMPLYDAAKTAQAIASGSEVLVTWNAATVNRGGFTIASNVLTVPTAGVYSIQGLISWPANATGYRISRIYVNGTLLVNDLNRPGGANSFTQLVSIDSLTLAASDTIEIRVVQDSGSSLTVAATSRLLVRYVCP